MLMKAEYGGFKMKGLLRQVQAAMGIAILAIWAIGCPLSEGGPDKEDSIQADVPDADTASPPQADDAVVVDGPAGSVCIAVNPEKIEFGGKKVGEQAILSLEIGACGVKPLEVFEIHVMEGSSPDFDLDLSMLEHTPTQQEPLVILGDETVIIEVSFVPDAPNPLDDTGNFILDTGTVVIVNSSAQHEKAVGLSGVGVEIESPMCVIECAEGNEVAPGTVLHLFGDESYPPSGSIQKWEWDVEKPVGSKSVFVPSYTSPNPTFEVDVVGIYTFYLTCYDQTNTPSCFPETYEVAVISNGCPAVHPWLTEPQSWKCDLPDGTVCSWPAEGCEPGQKPDNVCTCAKYGDKLRFECERPFHNCLPLEGSNVPEGTLTRPLPKHREVTEVCESTLEPRVDPTCTPTNPGGANPENECTTDADCEGEGARCLDEWQGMGETLCTCHVPECFQDLDCPGTAVCSCGKTKNSASYYCEGPTGKSCLHECLFSDCQTDADCGEGKLCSPSWEMCGWQKTGYHCHDPEVAECFSPWECMGEDSWGCNFEKNKGWICQEMPMCD